MTDATPAILSVAPNGARRTKADHPALPMTPADLAAAAVSAQAAGASLIHLHVRDADGRHTLDPGIYREATAEVRAAVGDGMIVQITTEAVGLYTPEQQIATVRTVRPEAASVALREIVPDDAGEALARDFYHWATGEGIHLQHILFTPEEVARFAGLCARGVIPGEDLTVLYVLGRYTVGQKSDPSDLDPFLAAAKDVPAGLIGPWFVCAFGAKEGACVGHAIAHGGHARVGFENNMLLPDGTTAPDNAALVTEAAKAAAAAQRAVATGEQARAILGMGRTPVSG